MGSCDSVSDKGGVAAVGAWTFKDVSRSEAAELLSEASEAKDFRRNAAFAGGRGEDAATLFELPFFVRTTSFFACLRRRSNALRAQVASFPISRAAFLAFFAVLRASFSATFDSLKNDFAAFASASVRFAALSASWRDIPFAPLFICFADFILGMG